MPQPIAQMQSGLTLADLNKNVIARVVGFNGGNTDMETRLREIGFAEGDEVEPLHRGVFRSNPMAVRLNSAMIALRRAEARCILVDAQDTNAGRNS